MAGSIHGIYFTNDGVIPENVVTNLKRTAAEAIKAGCSVVFWTDTKKLKANIKQDFLAAGVEIRDYRNVNKDLDVIIDKFVNQGQDGDVTSYALASDILRVAIAGSIPEDDLFIYADCNDITFSRLGPELADLAEQFKKNPWGLAFPINVLLKDAKGIGLGEIRNDRMIVRKSNNPEFFNHFISNYTQVVINKAPSYVKTNNSNLKKKQADEISCFTSSIPFEILTIGKIRMAGDNKTSAAITDIDFSRYMTTQRHVQSGNLWRDLKSEGEADQDLDALALAYARSLEQSSSHSLLSSQKIDNNYSSSSVSMHSFMAKHPFDEYKINNIHKEKDGTFVMRVYPNVLTKIYNFGTGKERYEDLIYNSSKGKVNIFERDKNDVLEVVREVEKYIAERMVTIEHEKKRSVEAKTSLTSTAVTAPVLVVGIDHKMPQTVAAATQAGSANVKKSEKVDKAEKTGAPAEAQTGGAQLSRKTGSFTSSATPAAAVDPLSPTHRRRPSKL